MVRVLHRDFANFETMLSRKLLDLIFIVVGHQEIALHRLTDREETLVV
jgi:hypothetical protein